MIKYETFRTLTRHSSFVSSYIHTFGYFLYLVALTWGIYGGIKLVLDSGNSLAIYNLGIDTKAYSEMAQALAADGYSVWPSGHPPGHIFILSLFYRLFDSPIVAFKLFNLFLVVLSALFGLIAGRCVGGTPVGLLLSLIIVHSDSLRAYSATIQYEVLAFFIVSLASALFLLSWTGRFIKSKNTLYLSAFVVGLGALVREPLLLLVLPMIISLACGDLSLREKLHGAGRIFVLAILPVLFWGLSQRVLAGEWRFFSAKTEINLEIGNNPFADGSFNVGERGIGSPSGVSFVIANPKRALELFGRKILYLLGVMRDGWNVPKGSLILFWRTLGTWIDYRGCILLADIILLVPGFLLAMKIAILGPRLPSFVYLSLGAILSLLFFLPFIASYRFSIPVLLILNLLSLLSLVSILEFRPKVSLVIAGLAFCSALLGYVSPNPLSLQLSFSDLDGQEISPGPSGEILANLTEQPRLIAFYPHQFYPAGEYKLSAKIIAEQRNIYSAGSLKVRDSNGRALCVTKVGIPIDSKEARCKLSGGVYSVELLSPKGAGQLIVEGLVLQRL